ncbi:hypothetical protein, partial [Streptomyces microflavus]|uniref:hypothetical protein n=1 Tax=Streptomyces microflavus TaxID=1919 RepID=UPI00339E69BF
FMVVGWFFFVFGVFFSVLRGGRRHSCRRPEAVLGFESPSALYCEPAAFYFMPPFELVTRS